jgi:aryl-alcohol dehydrogenase-like predicted oxidoreductase
VGCIPWSPLARGLLAGSRGRDGQRHTTRANSDPFADAMYREADFDVVDSLNEVARAKDANPATVALAWLLHKPGVSAPNVGATKLHHLEDAIAAVDVSLTDEEIKQLEAAYVPHPVLGHT